MSVLFGSDIFQFIKNCISTIRFEDIFDIIAMSFIIYQVLKFVRNTRTAQLLKGILLYIAIMLVSQFLNMNATSFVLKSAFDVGILAVLIMFQPELRKVLEQIGKGGMKKYFNPDERLRDNFESQNAVNEVINAAAHLSAANTGALIVFEREIKISEIIESGVAVDSKISSQLLENIFFVNTPLHDGAVIIRNGRVAAAACLLPLTDNKRLSTELGTRHRAAIGISEASDALALVVSEETGTISLAKGGKLIRGLPLNTLKEELLTGLYGEQKPEKKHIIGRRKK